MDKAVEAAKVDWKDRNSVHKWLGTFGDKECWGGRQLNDGHVLDAVMAAITAADEARAVTDEEIIITVVSYVVRNNIEHMTTSDVLAAIHAAGFKVIRG